MSEERTIKKEDAGLRLDRWFKRHHPGLTHAYLEKLLRTGAIRLDGRRAKSSDRIEAGQKILVPAFVAAAPGTSGASAPSDEDARLIRKLIIAEEADFFVLNKPPGLAVQGGSGTRRHIDGMLGALTKGRHRPRLVHRLDRDTSGVLLVARTAASAAALSKLFQARKVTKLYWALVHGVPNPREGEIDMPLAKFGPRGQEKMRVEEGGQRAFTRYRVVDAAGQKVAWVALEPITGRTHQLRAHMAALGHPILGDPKYGGEGGLESFVGLPPGLELHARSLTLPGPGGRPRAFEAPLPAHMRSAWRLFGFEEGAAIENSRPKPRARAGLARP
ncbi:MAG: RluA family pseudouridine synthase [Alphaproteobacteria bacterium]